eukprot:2936604-Pyramimonas_sp.AAC.1
MCKFAIRDGLRDSDVTVARPILAQPVGTPAQPSESLPHQRAVLAQPVCPPTVLAQPVRFGVVPAQLVHPPVPNLRSAHPTHPALGDDAVSGVAGQPRSTDRRRPNEPHQRSRNTNR